MSSPVFSETRTGGARRIVTGVDARGRAVVVADERVTGEPRALAIWSADASPHAGDAARRRRRAGWPPPGGIRVT